MEALQEKNQQVVEATEAETQAFKVVLNDLKFQCTEMPIEVDIAKLVRPPYHQRERIKEKYISVEKSIRLYGFLGGIFICEGNYHVIDGWHRRLMWDNLGNKTIPCYFVTCTEQQERELHIRLNTQAAAFDLSKFGLTMPDVDLVKEFGFTQADLKAGNLSSTVDERPRISKAATDFMKVSALLKTSVYDRLNAIKEKLTYENWPDVFEALIEAFERMGDENR